MTTQTAPETLSQPDYVPITGITAPGIAEGWIDATEDQQIEAWQYLHDSVLAYRLQGWFGRTAQQLIRQGVITN
jgi:hypothetical protein